MVKCIICDAEITKPRKNGTICRACHDTANPALLRKAQSLRHWYGLKLADYNALVVAQRNLCAVCGEPFGTDANRSPAVDHNHATGVVRGVVHQDCNRGLGHFGDDPSKLEKAAAYLRTAATPFCAVAGRYVHSLQKQRVYRQRKKSG